ncbi:hypothetical protein MIR68_006142 [Amoeboaphelidium protococcarum]|nr:hypothetical protein MIR68_006142 [Amoeboaphelidium protococcarum]
MFDLVQRTESESSSSTYLEPRCPVCKVLQTQVQVYPCGHEFCEPCFKDTCPLKRIFFSKQKCAICSKLITMVKRDCWSSETLGRDQIANDPPQQALIVPQDMPLIICHDKFTHGLQSTIQEIDIAHSSNSSDSVNQRSGGLFHRICDRIFGRKQSQNKQDATSDDSNVQTSPALIINPQTAVQVRPINHSRSLSIKLSNPVSSQDNLQHGNEIPENGVIIDSFSYTLSN